MTERGKSITVLTMNTVAFTVCFASWMAYGVLATFLVDNGLHRWDAAQMGWLIGIPVLSGSIFRLPVGIATDKWGGRPVFVAVLLAAAVPMWCVSLCDEYWQFLLAGLGFGLAGTGFAVGIAFTSVWFPAHRQGTALGVFGMGNAGAALTQVLAPPALTWFTNGGANLEGWRTLPKVYAASLVAMAILFWFTTHNRIPEGSRTKSLRQRLAPLREVRVWRFGLYYFFVFGGFVALAQWLVPYYVNVYAMSLAMAGVLAMVNSFPSGVIRALGGWMSDRFGARAVMFGVFAVSIVCCALLIVPQMDIRSPGSGVQSDRAGTVAAASPTAVTVASPVRGARTFSLVPEDPGFVTQEQREKGLLVLPQFTSWQEPAVQVGQEVKRREVIGRGWTRIFFQANVWIFTGLSFLLGIAMGIGKAGVYRFIPDYFPRDVGVVGGIVGVIGGLGGWVCPVIFGYLLQGTGIWTTCWMFFLVLSVACLVWMHLVVRRIVAREAPDTLRRIEHGSRPPETPDPVRA